jgi:serine/threonine protein kinase
MQTTRSNIETEHTCHLGVISLTLLTLPSLRFYAHLTTRMWSNFILYIIKVTNKFFSFLSCAMGGTCTPVFRTQLSICDKKHECRRFYPLLYVIFTCSSALLSIFQEKDAAYISGKLLSAITYMHDHGIVHR